MKIEEIPGKIPVGDLTFNKNADLHSANLLKIDSLTSSFKNTFCLTFRKTFLKKHFLVAASKESPPERCMHLAAKKWGVAEKTF